MIGTFGVGAGVAAGGGTFKLAGFCGGSGTGGGTFRSGGIGLGSGTAGAGSTTAGFGAAEVGVAAFDGVGAGAIAFGGGGAGMGFGGGVGAGVTAAGFFGTGAGVSVGATTSGFFTAGLVFFVVLHFEDGAMVQRSRLTFLRPFSTSRINERDCAGMLTIKVDVITSATQISHGLMRQS